MINEPSNAVVDITEWLVNKIGLKLKENLIKEWIETMQLQNSNLDDYVHMN